MKKNLTDLKRWRRDVKLMLYNREHQMMSKDHTAQVLISILSIFRTRQIMASLDTRRVNQPRQVIKLNCSLYFVNFSLTVLLLLQIHFLYFFVVNIEKRKMKMEIRKLNKNLLFAMQILSLFFLMAKKHLTQSSNGIEIKRKIEFSCFQFWVDFESVF